MLHSSSLTVEPLVASTNEEKSIMLEKLMFSNKPNNCQVATENYNDQLLLLAEMMEAEYRGTSWV